MCKISDKAIYMIQELLVDAFKQAKIPFSFYKAKKIINKLCLHYTKIDSCLNDCMLYLGKDTNRDFCKKFKRFRRKPT